MNGDEYEKGKRDGTIIQELRDINAHLVDIKESVKGHEKRLRALENWRWWLIGVFAAGGIGAYKIASAMLL